MPNANKAIVIKTNGRFFCKYKSKRISTTWSLVGAKLFGLWQKDEINKIMDILSKKGYKMEVITISIKLK